MYLKTTQNAVLLGVLFSVGVVAAVFFVYASHAFADTFEETRERLMRESGLSSEEAEEFLNTFPPLGSMGPTTDGYNPEGKDGILECFNYYRFQSVNVNVGTARNEYKPGEVVAFHGMLENTNNYPVVDGNVFVRIARENENYLQEGHHIIDEFFAFGGIILDANGKEDIQFAWKVPDTIEQGNYIATFYYSVGKNFNLAGLPFSNDVVGGQVDFRVNSSVSSSLSFDRGDTLVGGHDYRHIGYWPTFDVDEAISVKQPIVNGSNEPKEIEVSYDLFFWDSLDKEDHISTKKEIITILAGGTQTLEYDITDTERSVYYVRITATSLDEKEIVNLRVVRSQNEPRLNYPGLTKFPLSEGDSVTLFACFHNTGVDFGDGRVSVSLSDGGGAIIARAEYDGVVNPDMMILKKEFIAQKPYDFAHLRAQITSESGEIIDRYETVYDISLCNKFEEGCVTSGGSVQLPSTKVLYIAGGIIIIVLMIVAILIMKIGAKKEEKILPQRETNENQNV